jgi:DNA-binding response OmpR family regulator
MPSPRVLIVDDEQPLARILSFAFVNEGYRVDVATDGIDCMNKVATFAPDLVIMDIMMPKLDGIETIKLLRQNELHKGMGIAAMSAKTSPSTRDEALAAGADLFLRKPFQIATLVEQVEGLLASKTQKS